MRRKLEFLVALPGALPPEICTAMGWCTIWLVLCAAFAVAGWALAFSFHRRAVCYRAAFDRAFDIARRAYHFTDDETDELTRIIGEPIERRRRGTTR